MMFPLDRMTPRGPSALECRSRPEAFLAGVFLVLSFVTCRGNDPAEPSPVGTLLVSNTTTGGAFDLDGFVVRVDGGARHPMELNDSLILASWSEGTHVVELDGLAGNCYSREATAREVSVTRGASIRVAFAVSCTPWPELADTRILFSRARERSSAIVAVNADGSDEVTLLSGDGLSSPDLSPDGTRIVFIGTVPPPDPRPTLHLMSADGSGVTELPWDALDARWSPDGREIAFTGTTLDDFTGLFVMPAEGTQPEWITGELDAGDVFRPAWSPDGQRIAFTRASGRDLYGEPEPPLRVWVIGRDGREPAPLAGTDEGAYPEWSSDDRIAFLGFSQGRVRGIETIRGDDATATTILDLELSTAPWPVLQDWSSDGSLLLFTRDTGADRSDIFLLRVADGVVVRVTADGARNTTPTFW